MRADMRGRSIARSGDLHCRSRKAPEGAASGELFRYYYDSNAADDGQFYGCGSILPAEDAKAMTASLTEFTDCADPVAAVPADGHGAPAGGHVRLRVMMRLRVMELSLGRARSDAHGGGCQDHPTGTVPKVT